MSSSTSALSPLEALKAGFRRACVRRLVGDEDGAISVFNDEITGLVVAWAKVSNLEPSEKKAKLKEMFDDESARADELATAFDLFAGRFETRVVDLVRTELSGVVSQISKFLDANPKEIRVKPTRVVSDDDESNETQVLESKEEIVSEKDEKLDPPRGMGLKFDEIEKMIDQVLSQTKES